MKSNKDAKKGKKWLKYIEYLILGSFIVKLLNFVKKDKIKQVEDNFQEFFKEEKEEIEELVNGKESLKRFCRDSGSIFKDFFVPHDGNGHKPKILRTKSLTIVVIALICLKVVVTSYLFLVYPNLARMSQLISQEIHELTNNDRVENNLATLTINEKLNAVALVKANDMINNNYFAHQSPDGKMPWDLINRDEYPYIYVGENLAMNFTSAKSAHNALMLSPTHKKNILNKKYTEVGFAVVSGEINDKKTNVLVEIFAAKKTAPTTAIAKATPAVVAVAENTAPTEKEPEPEEQSNVLSAEHKSPEAPPKAKDPIQEPPASELVSAITPLVEKEIPKQPPVEVEEGLDVIEAEIASMDEEVEILPSPNPELEAHVLAGVKEIEIKDYKKMGTAANLITFSKYIFIAVLALLVVSLFVNIFVRISIQHKPVIVQTLLVIIFIAGLVSVKVHFLEGIVQKIAIL